MCLLPCPQWGIFFVWMVKLKALLVCIQFKKDLIHPMVEKLFNKLLDH